eukprot:TRINITY_DN8143_c0_g1_i3.p1 TRINITY_DN8143_c0_g1~~TRINITY_DN8143_c0_g1_i3.p1  ORF type:complete len:403 (-),score=27.41 TRINITY_DN8143_c0_g1_i3:336-1544(-)
MMQMRGVARRVLLLAFLSTLCTFVHCGILDYNEVPIPAVGLRYERTSMYALGDAPIGSIHPHATFDLTFLKNTKATAGHVEILFFHIKELKNIGYRGPAYRRYLCCTPELEKAGTCHKSGTVVINTAVVKDPNILNYQRLEFQGDTNVTFSKQYNITESGLYYFFVVNCDEATGTLDIDGTTLWINPYGYLEASEFGFIPFYIVLTFLFAILLVVWLIPFYRYHEQSATFQRFITGIIALGLAESALSLAEVLHYNANGHLVLPLVVVTGTVDTLWRTSGRLLLLAVCMGYGISRRGLHKALIVALVVFGVIYYFFSFLAELIDDLQDKTLYPINPALVFFSLMPLIVLDSIFFAWVFVALFLTMRTLQAQNDRHKFRLYVYLAVTMGIGLVLSLAMIVLEE